MWKLPLSGGPPVQVTNTFGLAVVEGPEGSLYVARRVPTLSLWRTPINDASAAKEISGSLSDGSNFSVTKRGVYFMESSGLASTAKLMLYSFQSGRTTELLNTGKRWTFGVTISPDERWAAYAVIDSAGSDLNLLETAR